MKESMFTRRTAVRRAKAVILLGLIAEVIFDKNDYDPGGPMAIVRVIVRGLAILGIAVWMIMTVARYRRASSTHARHPDSKEI